MTNTPCTCDNPACESRWVEVPETTVNTMTSQRTVKTLDTLSAATRYAAACERNERDPRVRYLTVPSDGKWLVVKDSRKAL